MQFQQRQLVIYFHKYKIHTQPNNFEGLIRLNCVRISVGEKRKDFMRKYSRYGMKPSE